MKNLKTKNMSDIKNIADYLKSEEKTIKLYHKNGKLSLWYFKYSDGYWYEITYDENGNAITFKNSNGYWYEHTYDENGKELTYRNSNGYWHESTYDENGNDLTYKNSNGYERGFDCKELTIEEIQKELGYKIKIVE